VALITVPRKRRQGFARLLRDASTRVHDQLIQTMDRRLTQNTSEQLNAIRKHLGNEAQRASNLSRRLVPQPAASAHVALSTAMPLSARDETDLRTSWRESLERRLAELTPSAPRL
jgi:hypothetical protein